MTRSGDLTSARAWQLLADDADAVLVDVRTRAEWTFVGVPDLSGLGRAAVLLEWVTFPAGARGEDFLDRLAAQVPPEAPVVFLCRSGHRSAAAADAAAAAGYASTWNVTDGFEGEVDAEGHRGATGWRAQGLPWRQS